MYTDLYLKFADEIEAIDILYTVTPSIETEEGAVTADAVITPNYQNIDTIGIIYEPMPDPLPEPPPEPVPYDGWFVNVRVVDGENAEPLMPFSIDPKPYPMRIWA
jgi:hypothetical protein